MQINRCINCENAIQHYPCPHCGFDIAGYQHNENALPCNTILRGRYLIGKVLGQGGFGITYVGWDLALEIRVAIKEFYPRNQVSRSTASTKLIWHSNMQAATLQKSGMETFLKEARKMAKVEKIPEVVRVRDTFAENETAYIVMDFVDGENLKDYLKNNGTLSWEKAQKIFFPVISAMEQVHNMGIIHRDISPDNLMILPNGTVNILDLGAAKDLSVSSGLSSEVVAKAGFSPFEQYVQRGGSGTWTDVYATAATVYYALTGKLPPAAPDRVNATFNGKPDPLEWNLPQLRALPANVLEALQNAMKISAKERTQTMHELLEQLRISPKAAPKCPVCEGELSEGSCPVCGYGETARVEPFDALPSLSVLGKKYVIVRYLYSGCNYANEYLAWDKESRSRVLIREFKPDFGSVSISNQGVQISTYDFFVQEAKKLEKFRDIRWIVQYKDFFLSMNSRRKFTAYNVFEYVDGETLYDRVTKNGPLSWKEAKPIFLQWIGVIEKVHQRGIICTGIDAKGVFLKGDGLKKFALNLGDEKLADACRRDDLYLHKRPFSAVEKSLSNRTIGPWTDVYSMAAIMYWALTGRLPVCAIDQMNGMKIDWDLPELKRLPKSILTALQNAMKLNANERTQTMHELFEQLKTETASVVPPVNPPKDPPKKPPEKPPVSPPPKPPQEPILRCTVCNTPLDKRGRCPKCTPQKPGKWLGAIGAVVAAIVICLISGVHPHQWAPADCETPRHCLICGQTDGKANGHKWIAATCTEAAHCSVCNATGAPAKGHKWVAATCTKAGYCAACHVAGAPAKGHKWVAATCTQAGYCLACHVAGAPAKGHQWVEATYIAPKTCKVCKATEGYVKGYIKELSWRQGDMRIELAGTRATPKILDKELKNCIRMTLNFQITKVDYGNPYGRWVLYGKDLKGSWNRIFYFNVPDGNLVSEVIEFNTPESFKELFIANVSNTGSASWSSSSSFTDVYTRDDS